MKNGSILSQSTGQVGLGLRDSQQGEAQPETGQPAPVARSRGNPHRCSLCGTFMARVESTPDYDLYRCLTHPGEHELERKTTQTDYYWPEDPMDLEILEQERPIRLSPESRRRLIEGVRRRRWRPMWTPEEEKVLIDINNDPHAYRYEAAAKLGRTINAVACKANELGLRKRLQEWPE